MNTRILTLTALLAVAVPPTWGQAEENAFTLEAETGGLWFSRNRTQIPSDTGNRFDLDDLTGSGPDGYLRLSASYRFDPKHSLRFTYAPIRASGSGALEEDVQFVDADFTADAPARGVYRFDTYRLTYRWTFHSSDAWDFGIGASVLIRDAKIQLEQDATVRSDDDVGVVPLLHLYAARHLGPSTSVVLDIEGAAAPQGRAIDASLTLRHTLPSGWHVFAGYRTLEGGADNNDVYTFAWMHFATVGFGVSF
ncbi:MAG: hypothetical protein EA417_15645 [Gammaproteobacteria bacterium]|nr:MAG: hypothetical protein EA417_15645 [Gammaproteobacteria bacterium]